MDTPLYPMRPENPETGVCDTDPGSGPGTGLVRPSVGNGNYGGEMAFGVRRTSVPTALANQVIQFNARRDTLSLTFEMTNDEYSEWFDWAKENAWWWFRMELVTPWNPVDIVSLHRVRFISELEMSKAGDNWNRITVQAEVMPADGQDPAAPVDISDWVIAGTPANPSPDWVIAGTPANPSTDWIIAHLYRQ